MVAPLATWRSLGLALAVAAAVLIGLSLRLEDPLSRPMIPAEDPYTHMALVREHLRDGQLDPLNSPGSLYPPGMHALMAGIIAYTGVELYDLTRAGPAFFGALGLVGVALLLSRFESLGAALAGVLALAVAPEAIFRTTMMSPTAVDLALVPFLAYCLLETLRGRLAWAGGAVALSAFLVLSHPWLFGILGVAGLGLILFVTLLPWPERYGPLITPWGFVACIAIVGTGVALALSGCWGGCGPGFRDVVGDEGLGTMNLVALATLVVALLPLLVMAVKPRAFAALMPRSRTPAPFALRLVLSQLLLAGVVAATFWAAQEGMPPLVDLPRMFGWPLLLLGGLGLVVLPFRPSPAGHLGAGLALATYPFVVFDPFASPFWSHRTAVYFGIGLCILVGVAIAALVQGGLAAARRLPTGPAAPATGLGAMPAGAPAPRAPGRVAPVVALSGLFLMLCLAGGAYAATPAQYEGGWYRLYPDCEYEGLVEISELATANPDLLVITADWQSRLILAGLTDGADRIWYKPDFYRDPDEQATVITMQEEKGDPILVLVDSKLEEENKNAPIDPSFLDESPWVQYGTWCEPVPPPGADPGAPALPPMRAYTLES